MEGGVGARSASTGVLGLLCASTGVLGLLCASTGVWGHVAKGDSVSPLRSAPTKDVTYDILRYRYAGG